VILTPLCVSLFARWMVLRGRHGWEFWALLNVHNLVLAEVFGAFVLATIALIIEVATAVSPTNDNEHCQTFVWWLHRLVGDCSPSLALSGMLSGVYLLCSANGVGRHDIRMYFHYIQYCMPHHSLYMVAQGYQNRDSFRVSCTRI